MRATVWIGLASVLLLAGCESRLNPVNWFGGNSTAANSSIQPVAAGTDVDETTRAIRDPRPAIDQVTSLRVEDVPGGVLVTAIGLPPSQGFFAAALVPETIQVSGRPAPVDGIITLRFVAAPPPSPQPVGTVASREITAGAFLTTQTLSGVRSIRVRGERNERSARP